MSNESIIAIVTLVATSPPSLVLIWHLLRRKHLNLQREVQGLFQTTSFYDIFITEIALDVERTSRSTINLRIAKHVQDTIIRPGLARLAPR
jgi:hypothetical protein